MIMVYAPVERRYVIKGGYGVNVCRGFGVYRARNIYGQSPPGIEVETVLVTGDEGIAERVCVLPAYPLDIGFDRPMHDWRPH